MIHAERGSFLVQHRGGTRPKLLLCAVLGHDWYQARGWYFEDFGCHRCGIRSTVQWALLNQPPLGADSSTRVDKANR